MNIQKVDIVSVFLEYTTKKNIVAGFSKKPGFSKKNATHIHTYTYIYTYTHTYMNTYTYTYTYT